MIVATSALQLLASNAFGDVVHGEAECHGMLCLQVTEEARDNLKFLTTLERHFKNITSGPLPAILDMLPPTMNALRMVWIISRYYSDDMRMGALFKRIGHEIGDRVEAAIDVKVWHGHRMPQGYLALHCTPAPSGALQCKLAEPMLLWSQVASYVVCSFLSLAPYTCQELA